MTTIKTIRNQFGNNICRKCINETYKTDLSPKECEYEIYPATCPKCKEVKNIVCGLRLKGKLKLIGK